MEPMRSLRLPGLAALLLPLLAGTGCAARAPRPDPLRVLVYNIHAGKDAAGEHNLERVAGVVLRSEADLVLLQEVDVRTERSGGEDQLAILRRLTGYHGAFGRTLDYQGGEYGIAVLSRWPVEEHALRPLPVDPPQPRAGGSREPRGALAARVAAPGGPVHLLNTHLDASADDRYRLQEVARVAGLADSLRALPGAVLVGGDLNAEPGSAVLERLLAAGWTDAWAGCGAGAGYTYPADEPRKRIDYLLLSPSLACRSAAVLDDRASDHRAVLFVLSPSAERDG